LLVAAGKKEKKKQRDLHSLLFLARSLALLPRRGDGEMGLHRELRFSRLGDSTSPSVLDTAHASPSFPFLPLPPLASLPGDGWFLLLLLPPYRPETRALSSLASPPMSCRATSWGRPSLPAAARPRPPSGEAPRAPSRSPLTAAATTFDLTSAPSPPYASKMIFLKHVQAIPNPP
jgi:hypothetical protein